MSQEKIFKINPKAKYSKLLKFVKLHKITHEDHPKYYELVQLISEYISHLLLESMTKKKISGGMTNLEFLGKISSAGDWILQNLGIIPGIGAIAYPLKLAKPLGDWISRQKALN
jgi:hypothetical protein